MLITGVKSFLLPSMDYVIYFLSTAHPHLRCDKSSNFSMAIMHKLAIMQGFKLQIL